jgi:hypothetical protein
MHARLAPPGEPVHQTACCSAGGRAFGFGKALGAGHPDRAEAELVSPLF